MAKLRNMNRAVRKFNAEIQEFAKKILPAKLVEFHKKIALDALSGIVQRTPVDTGRARGNWQVTIDAPAHGEISTARGASATLSKGAGALSSLTPFRVVWLTNNVPYIGELEEGHSKRAPNGMVALTLNELMRRFD